MSGRRCLTGIDVTPAGLAELVAAGELSEGDAAAIAEFRDALSGSVPAEGPDVPARPRPRRTERIEREDGTAVPMAKQARADLLRYPAAGGTEILTVLVRRTHDVAYARTLAEECWAAAGQRGELARTRTGWFLTYTSSRLPAGGAWDPQGRAVAWTLNSLRHGAGPGVEFRP